MDKGPYVFTLDSGSLPGDYKLSAGGIISGMAGTAGTYSFTLRVTDSQANFSTKALAIIVNPPSQPTISTLTLPDAAATF